MIRNFFARDNSFMTPWGPIISSMQLKTRKTEYNNIIKFYQEKGVEIFKYITAGHMEGGDFVIIKPGLALIGYSGIRSEYEGAK